MFLLNVFYRDTVCVCFLSVCVQTLPWCCNIFVARNILTESCYFGLKYYTVRLVTLVIVLFQGNIFAFVQIQGDCLSCISLPSFTKLFFDVQCRCDKKMGHSFAVI